ncbi:VOC family protein [Urechidicola vernalis]|uniref:VOC family protein n=1 Tax=Urechidicola vernalis TaxID=3075600 RepID=A0ABU2Y7P0_9FLAO|nr:VOC family protein [Urechidicola sp. P050]MDT0553815.1 VOC family protein [Urechidicola sp. P050]
MKNAVNWFEIPVTNYERAKTFYNTILNLEIQDYHMPEKNMEYGMFPYDMQGNGVGGAIVKMEGLNPSSDGSTVYLNGGDDLSVALEKVESAGGTIIMPKMDIDENGFIAQFIDTEGNRVALHSMN